MGDTAQDREVKRLERVQEALAKAGFADHRPLTTADVPAIAEYVRASNRSSSKPTTTKKRGSK